MGDGRRTRQLRLTAMINAPVESLLPLVYTSSLLTEWQKGSYKCEITHIAPGKWMNYTVYKVPKPFKQKDLITECTVHVSETGYTIYMESKPNYLPQYEGISRMKHFKGRWVFIQNKNGATNLEMYSYSMSKSKIPRFIQDPIVHHLLIESILNMRKLINKS